MTPPPESPDRETLEEIADRIAGEWFEDEDQSAGALVDAIVSALRNERERCARIAKTHNDSHVNDGEYHNCGLAIAERIEE